MATTDYDFQSNRNEVIQRAFRIVGALSLGEQLSAEQITQGNQALNDMVKSWQSDRIFLWTLKNLTQALTATNASYALGSDPPVLAIDKAYLRINGEDEPLEVASWRQYWDIPNKTDPGDPVLVAIDNQPSPTLYVWPVPTTNRTLYYLAVTKLKDWDTSNSSADFPVKWTNALTYGLAALLADEYGLTLGEKQDLRTQAKLFYLEAQKGDREHGENEFLEPAFLYRRR